MRHTKRIENLCVCDELKVQSTVIFLDAQKLNSYFFLNPVFLTYFVILLE